MSFTQSVTDFINCLFYLNFYTNNSSSNSSSSSISNTDSNNLRQNLALSQTFTSRILNKTEKTVYLKDISCLESIQDLIPSKLVNLLLTTEYNDLYPENYNHVFFHDKMCDIILVIDYNKNDIKMKEKYEDGFNMCINITFLKN